VERERLICPFCEALKHLPSLANMSNILLKRYSLPAVRPRLAASLLALSCAGLLSGCYSLGSSGPHAGQIDRKKPASLANADIRVIDLTDTVARRLVTSDQKLSFAQVLGDETLGTNLIGPGDTLDISIWEAPPAVLFGTAAQTGLAAPESRAAAQARSVAQGTALPEQVVAEDGRIQVPFAGSIPAAGRTSAQIQGRLSPAFEARHMILRYWCGALAMRPAMSL
jgi:polysaccharide export outer membrane protein